MARVALVRAAALIPAWHFLRRIGAPVGTMLARVGLSADVLEHPETLVPLVVAARFLENAARREGDDQLGIRVGSAARFDALGVFGRQVTGARTLHEALAIAIRLAPSHNTGERYWLDDRAGEIRFTHRFVRRLAPVGHQAEQYALGLALALFRSVGGPDWRPARAYVKAGVGRGIANLEMFAGSEIVFEQEANGVVLSRKLLSTPLPRPAPSTTSTEEIQRWQASAPASDFAQAVRQAVTPLLAGGDVDVQALADAANMSVRTLQRRLHDAGTTYAHVLSDARFDTAAAMLTRSQTRIAEIAEALGYSHPSHFTRAFLRWSGTTPQRFRGLHQHAAAPAAQVRAGD